MARGKRDAAAIERARRGSLLPTSLPPEDEAEVAAILSGRPVEFRFNREQVTDRDIWRLVPTQWLNDEIINFYCQMILARSEGGDKENASVNEMSGKCGGKVTKKMPQVHIFSTFFWPKLVNEGYEKGRLAKWTKKVHLLSVCGIRVC